MSSLPPPPPQPPPSPPPSSPASSSSSSMVDRNKGWNVAVQELLARLMSLKTNIVKQFRANLLSLPTQVYPNPEVNIFECNRSWKEIERILCDQCRQSDYTFRFECVIFGERVLPLMVETTMLTIALAVQAGAEQEMNSVHRAEYLLNHLTENINVTCDPEAYP